MSDKKCPSHPKCRACGENLTYRMVPSGSGMLDTVGCPNKCRILHGINAILHCIGVDSNGHPVCGFDKDPPDKKDQGRGGG